MVEMDKGIDDRREGEAVQTDVKGKGGAGDEGYERGLPIIVWTKIVRAIRESEGSHMCDYSIGDFGNFSEKKFHFLRRDFDYREKVVSEVGGAAPRPDYQVP